MSLHAPIVRQPPLDDAIQAFLEGQRDEKWLLHAIGQNRLDRARFLVASQEDYYRNMAPDRFEVLSHLLEPRGPKG